MAAGNSIAYLELVTPSLEQPPSIGRALYWVDRDFPWARADGWTIEWWGVRSRESRQIETNGLRLRGPRVPFRRIPRILLVTLSWLTHVVLVLRGSSTTVTVARSPHLGMGASIARRFRRNGPRLVVRIVERSSSKALHVYGSRSLSRLLEAVDRFVLAKADLVFLLGDFTRDLARRAGVADADIVELPSPRAWDDHPGAHAGERDPSLVVCAARFHREKGVATLIEALGLIAADYPSAVVEIAGDGPERESLERFVADSGLGHRVRFRGWLPATAMPQFFGRALVAVAPSLVEEGHGRALQEAASAGCALIGSDLGGLKDTVVEGRTGLLVPPADPHALANALRRCLDDPTTTSHMGEAARAQALEYYGKREHGLEEVRRRLHALVRPAA
ncbi:MAG: glycosyltransferase family 4 protein [Actinomycetota bacterium]